MTGPAYTPPAAPADVNLLPESLGLAAWSVYPVLAAFAGTQANCHLAAVWLKAGTVITKLSVPVTNAGNAMTHAQLGVYDADLNLIASTADTPAAFQATGIIELPLSAPWTAPSDGVYYLASAYSGTTLPTVLNAKQDTNVSLALAGGKPIGVHAQAQGTLPDPAISQGVYTNFPLIMAR